MLKQNSDLVEFAREYERLTKKEKRLANALNKANIKLSEAINNVYDIEPISTMAIAFGGSMGISYASSTMLAPFEWSCVSYAGFVGMLGVACLVGSKIGNSKTYHDYKVVKAQNKVDAITKRVEEVQDSKKQASNSLENVLALSKSK